MVGSRSATALAGIAVGLLVSVAAWVYLDTLLLFLFVPFVPFLFRPGGKEQPPVQTCPTCGFTTRNPEFSHCPRDGARLE